MVRGMLIKIDWDGIYNVLKEDQKKTGGIWRTKYWTLAIRLFHPIWIGVEICPEEHKGLDEESSASAFFILGFSQESSRGTINV